ncbi:ATP-binding protein [Pelagicoccus sp. SDUM812005]|uniref:ATP-binding protein n=1 Tax=Pelagicoccus sp. SDUM812005 TaxID=3041257 RepID=UPI002810B4EB|nr:ATP-binding protein [Pelagicoccus sp. SDUM812005]
MEQHIRALDWSRTPLGKPETWPQSLRSSLSICMSTRFPIAIYWGAEGLLFYNDAWRPILGDKHPWALGRPGREVWSEIWDVVGPVFDGVMKHGEGAFFNDALLLMKRYGYTEECYFDYTFSPIRGEGGVVEGVFNAVTETTERVLSTRRGKQLREVAAAITEASSADEACKLAAGAMAGQTTDIPFSLFYLIEGSAGRLVASTGFEAAAEAGPLEFDLQGEAPEGWPVQAALDSGAPVSMEIGSQLQAKVPHALADSSVQDAELIPIKARDGQKVVGLLVLGINPLRALDEEYRDFLSLFASQVETAIAKATAFQEQQRRSEALAELDRAKTAFFSNVSHEFRTPLTLMLGPVEELLGSAEEEFSARNRELLELVNRNGQRLLRLVNTLLDFTRIEAGRAQASFVPTDLAAYTAELASNFRSACERAGLEFEVDCPPLEAPAYVDRGMWEKIVLNLLSNAFKFTFEGRIRIAVEQVGQRFALTVTDTGTGIPADQMPRLFERFHRIENARSRSHEGSGIGLALVQELVKLHGGKISADSVLDKGTTFTVSFPVGSAHLPQEHIGEARPLGPTAAKANAYVQEALRWEAGDAGASSDLALASIDGGMQAPSTAGARILVADDNADMREYVSRLLSVHFEIEAVGNGRAALAAVQRERPALVLADVMMPEMDGFQLLEAIRSDVATAELPVILLSARAGEESRVEGLEAGADDYLVKPFSSRELVARVSSHLELAAARKQVDLRFREMIDALPAAVYTTDAEGRLTHYNQAAVDFSGRIPKLGTDEWCISWKLYDADGNLLPRERSPMALALKEGRIVEDWELMVERPDGSRSWFVPYSTLLRDADGKVSGGINMLLDISDRKAAEAQKQRELEDAQRLQAISSQLVQQDNIQALCEQILDSVAAIMRSGFASMHILESGRAGREKALRLLAHRGFSDANVSRLEKVLLGPGDVGGLALARGERVTVFDLETGSQLSEEEREAYRSAGIRSVQSTPLRSRDGDTLGILSTYWSEPHESSQRELHLLDVLARQAADLLERRRIEERRKRNLERSTLLSEALQALQSAEDPECIAKDLFTQVAEHLDVDTFFNYRVNEKGDALCLHASAGLPEEIMKRIERIEFGQAICGTVAQTREPIVATDIQNSTYDKADLVRGFGIQCYACNPLMAGGRLIGTLSFASRTRDRFDSAELEFIRTVSQYVAVAMDRLDREKALRESEERFRALTNATTDAVYRMNPNWMEMRQLRGREFIADTDEPSRSWLDKYIHPEDQTEVLMAIKAAIRSRSTFEFEHRVRRVDGSLGWMHSRAIPIVDSNGKVVEWFGSASDITKRKQAEEALRRNAETFAALVEQSPLGIYTVDSNFKVAHVSVGAMPAFRSVDPLIGRDFAEIMHILWPEPFAEEAISLFRHTLKTGEPYVSPGLTEKRKDIGAIESYEWQLNRVTLADGQYGVVCYFFDATRLQEAVQALRESEERFRMLADNMSQLAWTCDELGSVNWYNQRWLEYTGCALEEMRGWGWKQLVHPEHVDRVVEGVMEVRDSETVWEDTFPLRGHGGGYRWFLSRAIPIRDEAGEIVSWFGTNTDVTELRETQQLLKEADRRKDEFLATLAHELRNPLAPIRTGLEIMKMAKGDGALVEETRATMERQTKQLISLVDDLLDVSRITRGKLKLRKAKVKLSEVIESAVESTRPYIAESKHELRVELPVETVLLEADPHRLAQVLSNLLNNSAKYTPEGGRITLSATRTADAVTISVEDNGLGIPPDMQEAIFEMFAQVDRPQEKGYTGLGIGLSLVKLLVEMHDGKIFVRSEGAGKGSVFSIRLPIIAEAAAPKAPAIPAGQEVGPGRKRRVLVVDDNQAAAKMLGLVVKMFGNEVRLAGDGQEAIEVAAEFRPNVVLMDLGMPKMNGYEAARHIRQQPWGKEMMLVALTGWGQEEDRRKTKEAGFDHHLVKPAEPAEVQRLLKEAEIS